MLRIVLAASALTLAAACATSTEPLPDPQPAPVVDATPSGVQLALETASRLSLEGNEQIAIDRLTQEIGQPDLSDADRAKLFAARGELRLGEGNDVSGAVSDFERAIELYGEGSAKATALLPKLEAARAELVGLEAFLANPDITRSERFETLFRMGRHDEAVDLLIQGGVTATPETLLDLYQIGYLCEGDGFTGQAYDIVEPDGTARTVRFCDFGK